MTQTYLDKHIEELTNRVIILEKMVAHLLYAETQTPDRRIEIPYPSPYKTKDVGVDDSELDPLYDEAWKVISEAGKASTSYLQRKISLGYNRASKIIDQLEREGVVGPAEGIDPRKILKKYNK